MFENNFLPFSQSKNECFLALDNFARRKEWDGMGRWRAWVSSSTTVFFWVQNHNNTHTFKLIIPYFNISGRLLFSNLFNRSPDSLTH